MPRVSPIVSRLYKSRRRQPHNGLNGHFIAARLDSATVIAIDNIAEARGITRSHAIASILRAAVAEHGTAAE